jgi:hypothetical protein
VTSTLAIEIEQVIAGTTPYAAFRLYRPTFFMRTALRHYGRAPVEPGQIRLFRKDAGRFNDRMVHETVQVQCAVGWLHAPLLHYSYPTLHAYWTKIHRYARLETQERARQRAARPGRTVRAAGKLVWMLIIRGGILDGPPAWLWIAGQAYQEWLST